MWLIAQGQLLSISQNPNDLLAASVVSHQQALSKIKTEIETLFQASVKAEIEQAKAAGDMAKRQCEALIAKYGTDKTIETQTFTT